jgi:Ca2+-binding EF-hand superfamily protein
LSFTQVFETFATLEKSADGTINLAAFTTLVQPMFAENNDELIGAIFEFMDLDDSQGLDAGEVLCALNLFCNGSHQDKVATVLLIDVARTHLFFHT